MTYRVEISSVAEAEADSAYLRMAQACRTIASISYAIAPALNLQRAIASTFYAICKLIKRES